jgi:hypothetical protein
VLGDQSPDAAVEFARHLLEAATVARRMAGRLPAEAPVVEQNRPENAPPSPRATVVRPTPDRA